MDNFIKILSNIFLRPVVARYLSLERVYHYEGLKLRIPPQIFHPAFFFSTKLLITYLGRGDLQNKRLLELGAGSGLIAMWAARKGALVTATDINAVAVEYLVENSRQNKLDVHIYRSDLFHDIPKQQFDFIIINPPYFKKHPVSDYDYAWYCGENGEYFVRLFAEIACFMHYSTRIIMILSDECDLKMISAYAARNGFAMQLQETKRKYWEVNLIYHILPVNERLAG